MNSRSKHLSVNAGVICVVLLMAACGGGNSSSSSSGISGGGVIAGATQTSIGDGSDSNWDAAKCELVAGFTKWRWRTKQLLQK